MGMPYRLPVEDLVEHPPVHVSGRRHAEQVVEGGRDIDQAGGRGVHAWANSGAVRHKDHVRTARRAMNAVETWSVATGGEARGYLRPEVSPREDEQVRPFDLGVVGVG